MTRRQGAGVPPRRGPRPSAARRLHAALTLAATTAVVALPMLGQLPAQAAAAEAPAPEYTATRTVVREHLEPDGTVTVADARDVTVTVDRTQSLRGRERIQVSWSGARPSAGRAVNPYGVDGMNQEYPVVVLQCRGLDDPDLDPSEQISPETCWTTTYLQRYSAVSPGLAVWRHDRFADPADRADQDGVAEWPEECARLPGSILSQRVLPFRAASGTSYASCDDATIAPESAIDAALPAAEVAAFTNLDGTGEVQFEVRTETENESLGCSSEVPCSLVVIPIMGVSCMDSDAACREEGDFEPGSSNFTNLGVDPAVSPRLWWTESNWRNRFSVPLTFALPPDACDVLDPRAPVDMFGSELLNQASLQWAPAYCLRADRFKFRHNRMSESAALRLLGTGGGTAAFVSQSAASSSVPLGYAPVAVTGFAISYVVDLPDNGGELGRLRLTPRLLAKLLTQSYPASNDARAHEGLRDNPLSLNLDPEFTELNPGLSMTAEEARATLLSLSESSDVVTAVTEYIAADEEAAQFIAGTPDPWGMVVNPSYRGMSLPRDEWPLQDTWVRPSQQECESQIQTPYLSLVAAPVSSLRKIAEAVLDGWPNVQTKCTRSTANDPWKIGRVDRQGYGSRFMLGVVSLGDADRYGLRTAELRTAGTGAAATFVAPSAPAMAAALDAASQTGAHAPFTIAQEDLSPAAYPGTMIVHVAARVSGLEITRARQVAQFIRTSTTEGQVPGPGNGELPGGYLPIGPTGPTAPLLASAEAVAAAIEAQAGPPTPAVSTPLPGAGTTTPAARPPSAGPVASAPDAGPVTVEGLPADDTGPTPVVASGTTVSDRARAAGVALPAAAGVALAGAVGAPALWAWSTRRRLV